jgi:hypothetical protein
MCVRYDYGWLLAIVTKVQAARWLAEKGTSGPERGLGEGEG